MGPPVNLRDIEVAVIRGGDPDLRGALAQLVGTTQDDRVLWAYLHGLWMEGSHREAVAYLVSRIVEDGWTHSRATMIRFVFWDLGWKSGLKDLNPALAALACEYGTEAWTQRTNEWSPGFVGDSAGRAWLIALEAGVAGVDQAPAEADCPTIHAYLAAEAQTRGDALTSFGHVCRLSEVFGECAFVALHKLQHYAAFDQYGEAVSYSQRLPAAIRDQWQVNYHLCRALQATGAHHEAKRRYWLGLRRHPYYARLAREAYWLGRPKWLHRVSSPTYFCSRVWAGGVAGLLLTPLYQRRDFYFGELAPVTSRLGRKLRTRH